MTSPRENREAPRSPVAANEARFQAFVVTAPGLAPLAARELSSLRIDAGEIEAAGVPFEGAIGDIARANFELRTASRILVRVDEFRAANFHELEKRTARIEWSRWLAPGSEIALRVTCRKSRLYHSGAVADRVGAQLVNAGLNLSLRATGAANGDDDDGDEGRESQLLVVRIFQDRCTISIDSSGELLHRRGYRLGGGKAPLRETLGAALVLASGWEPGTPLVDPFCGSGTIAIEAAMIARRLAPGRMRHFAFERWPGVNAKVISELRKMAAARALASPAAPIIASDRDAGVIAVARENAERAGVSADIDFAVRAISAITLPERATPTGAVVTNPPYGVRVGDAGTLRNLYARTGDVLRGAFPGWRVALVSYDRRLVGSLKLSLEERVRTINGGLAVSFVVGRVPALSPARSFTAPTDSIG